MPNDLDAIEALLRRVVAEHLQPTRLAYLEPEAAALLGVEPHVLRDARLREEIRPTKIGKRIAYRRDELDRYLLRGEQN